MRNPQMSDRSSRRSTSITFAGLPPNEQSAAFERILSFVAELRESARGHLRDFAAVLEEDDEADALVQLALRASLSLPTAQIDSSLCGPLPTIAPRARTNIVTKRSASIRDYESVARITGAVCSATRSDRESTSDARWKDLLQQWTQEAPVLRVGSKESFALHRQFWRVPRGRRRDPIAARAVVCADRAVRWIVEVPRYLRCNLTPAARRDRLRARCAAATALARSAFA